MIIEKADPNVRKSVRIWKWWANFRQLSSNHATWDEMDKAIFAKAYAAQLVLPGAPTGKYPNLVNL